MSIFSDIIGSVSPILGTALGGPVGGLLGSAISAALGVDPADQDAVRMAVKDPLVVQRLKELEVQAQLIQTTFELNMKRMDVENMQGARTLIQQFKFPMYIFSIIIFFYFAFYFFLGYMVAIGVADKSIFESVDFNIGQIMSSIITLLTGVGIVNAVDKRFNKFDKSNNHS